MAWSTIAGSSQVRMPKLKVPALQPSLKMKSRTSGRISCHETDANHVDCAGLKPFPFEHDFVTPEYTTQSKATVALSHYPAAAGSLGGRYAGSGASA